MNRPWFRLHGTTLIALAIVGAVLIYCQLDAYHLLGPTSSGSYIQSFEYGWPTNCVCRVESWRSDISSPLRQYSASVDWTWNVPNLVLDVVVAIVMLTAVGFMSERWWRRGALRWQFSLRSLFLLTAVLAALLAIDQSNCSATWPWTSIWEPDWVGILFGRASHWYIAVPLLLAIGCVVATILLVLETIARTPGVVRR